MRGYGKGGGTDGGRWRGWWLWRGGGGEGGGGRGGWEGGEREGMEVGVSLLVGGWLGEREGEDSQSKDVEADARLFWDGGNCLRLGFTLGCARW